MYMLKLLAAVTSALTFSEGSIAGDDATMVQVNLDGDERWPFTKKTSAWKSLAVEQLYTCAPLKNHGGTYFSVNISVGTPPQYFSVVADTGSNALIVPSCECVDNEMCAKDDACFVSENNKSTSLVLEKGPYGPYRLDLSFGSGDIETILIKDLVGIGEVNLTMERGLLIMTKNFLRISAAFEGILGLGPPDVTELNATSKEAEEEWSLEDLINGMGGASALTAEERQAKVEQVKKQMEKSKVAHHVRAWDWVKKFVTPAKFSKHASLAHEGKEKLPVVVPGEEEQQEQIIEEPEEAENTDPTGPISIPGPIGFLQEAEIDRFSICFSAATPGVLRFGTPKNENQLASMGKDHWGLDFRGISIGNDTSEKNVVFCSSQDMPRHQDTPCGAIPDSGTTLLLGPEEQVAKLFEQICDGWKRCKDNYTALVDSVAAAHEHLQEGFGFDPYNLEVASKEQVFKLLLQDCNSWLKSADVAAGDEGLNELPTLNFHVRGSKKQKEMLSLSGWSYVLETYEQGSDEEATRTICEPAIDTVEYRTETNGPIWILGSPIFYDHIVHYDLSTTSIAFESTKDVPCTPCGEEEDEASMYDVEESNSSLRRKSHHSRSNRKSNSLMARKSLQSAEAAARARPRLVTGKFRYPSYNLSKGRV